MVKILVDEHSDGWDIKLQKLGFDAQSVRKLNDAGNSMHTDFSVISYAQTNKMIFLTRDRQNIKACQENNIPCIPLDDESIFQLAVTELRKLVKTNSN